MRSARADWGSARPRAGRSDDGAVSDARPGKPVGPWLTHASNSSCASRFAHLEPVADAAPRFLYFRLFDLDPSVRALFAADMTAQRRNLMQTLERSSGHRSPGPARPSVAALGRRHAGLRLCAPTTTKTVEVALLDGMEETLGSIFDAETRAAWPPHTAISRDDAGTAATARAGHATSPRTALLKQTRRRPEGRLRMVGRQPLRPDRRAGAPPYAPPDRARSLILAIVEPIADVAATIFLPPIVRSRPALRDLFPADLTASAEPDATLTEVVRASIGPTRSFRPWRRSCRHTGYGVRSEHSRRSCRVARDPRGGTRHRVHQRDARCLAAAYGLLAGVMQEAGAAERSAA